MENYITEQKKAEEMYNGAEILVDLARRYPELWNEIDRQCTLNRERYGLLCEILLAGDEEFYESGIFSGTGKRGIKEKMVPAGGIAVRQKNK